MKLRRLGHSHRLLVAAPGYLLKHGWPDTPDGLSGHQGIRMSNVAGSDLLDLVRPNGECIAVPFDGRLRVDHGLAAREALLAGRGIAPAHIWLVDDLLAAGSLLPLLPGYQVSPVPLSMLVVPGRSGVVRVRVLADFLAKAIRAIPGMQSPVSGHVAAATGPSAP